MIEELHDEKPLEQQVEIYKKILKLYEKKIRAMSDEIGELNVRIEMLEMENEEIRGDDYGQVSV